MSLYNKNLNHAIPKSAEDRDRDVLLVSAGSLRVLQNPPTTKDMHVRLIGVSKLPQESQKDKLLLYYKYPQSSWLF